jgi:hypothetical protein
MFQQLLDIATRELILRAGGTYNLLELQRQNMTGLESNPCTRIGREGTVMQLLPVSIQHLVEDQIPPTHIFE